MNTRKPTYHSPEKCWYYARERQRVGPYSVDEMRQLLDEGTLKSTDMVWMLGTPKWREAGSIAEFESQRARKRDFPQVFFKDLEKLYRVAINGTELNTRDCLSTLTYRFDQRKAIIRVRRKRFSDDLTRLYDKVHIDPRKYLKPLEVKFKSWRLFTRNALDSYFNRLEPDDPLRSSISLFGTIDHGRMERAHTEVLAWLLDPEEGHEFGSSLLMSLWQQLQGEQRPFTATDNVRIKSENRVDDGSLDVFVDTKLAGIGKSALVIEAKINAKESEGQLTKYDKWIDKQGYSFVTRVFLTPDGRAPSSDKWRPLTFLKLGCIFRSKLTQLRQESRAGYHFLCHYLTGIFKDVYRWNLPIAEPANCVDPYGILFYLRSVSELS